MKFNEEKWNKIKKQTSDFLRDRGLIVVLSLCVICVAIGAIVRFLPNKQDEIALPIDTAQEANISADEKLNDALIAPIASPTLSPNITVVSTPSPTLKPAQKKEIQKSAPPVNGKILWGYAVDHLLYSETLEQWTTHEGVDISAKPGEEVRAIRAGTVNRIYNDNSLGVSVVISHDGGLVSIYANLAENKLLEEGKKINSGDIIGYVGDTALSECAMESHLHFAVYLNNKHQDPLNYILLDK